MAAPRPSDRSYPAGAASRHHLPDGMLIAQDRPMPLAFASVDPAAPVAGGRARGRKSELRRAAPGAANNVNNNASPPQAGD